MSISDDLRRILNSELSTWLEGDNSPLPAITETLRSQGHLAPCTRDEDGVTTSGQPLWRIGNTGVVSKGLTGAIGVRIGRGEYQEYSRDEALALVTALWSALNFNKM